MIQPSGYTQRLGPPRGHILREYDCPGWHPLVEQHSPGLLTDQNMLLPIGGGPISGVTEARRLDHSLTPCPAMVAAMERGRPLS